MREYCGGEGGNMKLNQASAKERFNALAEDIRYQRNLEQGGRPFVIMSGLNETSKEALLGRDFIIQQFPFTIGRFSPAQPFSSVKGDLLIADNRVVPISEQHLSIARRGDRITLSDPSSGTGSLVNKEPLGKNAGGEGEIEMKQGENETILGGADSPFVFQMRVLTAAMVPIDEYYPGFEEHVTPIISLYIRACHYVHDILTYPDYTAHERVEKALDIIRGILKDQETINMLYCYASHPHTFSDVIVAHSINVAIYALKLFGSLSYTRDETEKMGAAALLHDIGLFDIPREIVSKGEAVTEKEYAILKTHSTIGYEKLSGIQNEYKLIADLILQHHERIDGSGGPRGLSKVPEMVELFGMMDFFEAVTHNRAQRGPMTPHEGMKMMMESGREGVFSPKALRTFLNAFSLFPAYSVVMLNSGEIGQVVRTNPNWPLRPMVRILLRNDGHPVEERKEVDLLHDDIRFITGDISDRIFTDTYSEL
jgi:HD-GYP domain-containing protein (c-di-GMP phosphodiesterase class II)